jgi:hypothetical protein
MKSLNPILLAIIVAGVLVALSYIGMLVIQTAFAVGIVVIAGFIAWLWHKLSNK